MPTTPKLPEEDKMSFKFKYFIIGFQALFAAIVAGCALGLTVHFTSKTIEDISESWARGTANTIATSVFDFYGKIETSALQTSDIAKVYDLALPSDMVREGRGNWTDYWIPSVLQKAASADYRLSVVSVSFEDYYWMYQAFSRVYQGAAMVEWIENFPQTLSESAVTAGSFAFYINNRSKVEGHMPEIFNLDQSALYRLPRDVARSIELRQPDKFTPTCAAFTMSHTYLEHIGVYWEQYVFCSIINNTGTTLGFISVGIATERDLAQIISNSSQSANGQNFIIDKNGFLLGTTMQEQFWTSEPKPGLTSTDPVPEGCSSTFVLVPLLNPPRIGCRASFKKYPYPPLNALSTGFVLTSGSKFQFIKVDGEKYAVSSQRIVTDISSTEFNIIAVIPVSDLGVDSFFTSLYAAVGGSIAITVLGVALSIWMVDSVISRLDAVLQTMIDLGNLKFDQLNDEGDKLKGDDDDDDEEMRAIFAADGTVIPQGLIDSTRDSSEDGESDKSGLRSSNNTSLKSSDNDNDDDSDDDVFTNNRRDKNTKMNNNNNTAELWTDEELSNNAASAAAVAAASSSTNHNNNAKRKMVKDRHNKNNDRGFPHHDDGSGGISEQFGNVFNAYFEVVGSDSDSENRSDSSDTTATASKKSMSSSSVVIHGGGGGAEVVNHASSTPSLSHSSRKVTSHRLSNEATPSSAPLDAAANSADIIKNNNNNNNTSSTQAVSQQTHTHSNSTPVSSSLANPSSLESQQLLQVTAGSDGGGDHDREEEEKSQRGILPMNPPKQISKQNQKIKQQPRQQQEILLPHQIDDSFKTNSDEEEQENDEDDEDERELIKGDPTLNEKFSRRNKKHRRNNDNNNEQSDITPLDDERNPEPRITNTAEALQRHKMSKLNVPPLARNPTLVAEKRRKKEEKIEEKRRQLLLDERQQEVRKQQQREKEEQERKRKEAISEKEKETTRAAKKQREEKDNNNNNNNNNSAASASSSAFAFNEVRMLENSAEALKRNIINFTRYVSVAIVSDLIAQTKYLTKLSNESNEVDVNAILVFQYNEQRRQRRERRRMSSSSNNRSGSSSSLGKAPIPEINPFRSFDNVTVLHIEFEGVGEMWNKFIAADTNEELKKKMNEKQRQNNNNNNNNNNSDESSSAANHHPSSPLGAGVQKIMHVLFKRINRLCFGHGATIDKLQCDSLVAIWGAPVKVEHHALLAVLCAMAIRREVSINPLKSLFSNVLRHDLRAKMGISTGQAHVTSVGNETFQSFQIWGPVPMAAKALCTFNKYWGTDILMDQFTHEKCENAVQRRLLASVRLKQQQNNGGSNNNNNNHKDPLYKLFNEPVNISEPVGLDKDSNLVVNQLMKKQHKNINSNNNNNNTTSKPSLPSLSPAQRRQQQQQQNLIIPSAVPIAGSGNENDDDYVGDAGNNNNQEQTRIMMSVVDVLAAENDDDDQNSAVSAGTYSAMMNDAMSAATMQSYRISELLKASSKISNLITWHLTRTVATKHVTLFAERYSEAAAALIDCQFGKCLQLVEDIKNDGHVLTNLKDCPSMQHLERASRAYATGKERVPEQCIVNNSFVVSLYGDPKKYLT